MKANKLVVELFSLAILSGCLIACSKPTKEANTQSMQNMKVNRTNSNAKSNIFALTTIRPSSSLPVKM